MPSTIAEQLDGMDADTHRHLDDREAMLGWIPTGRARLDLNGLQLRLDPVEETAPGQKAPTEPRPSPPPASDASEAGRKARPRR